MIASILLPAWKSMSVPKQVKTNYTEISMHTLRPFPIEKRDTVLTSKTGGKSIIIELRIDVGSPKTCAHRYHKAEIEGFSHSWEYVFEAGNFLMSNISDEIIIRRRETQNGRSISRVNGQMVNGSLWAIGQISGYHGRMNRANASPYLMLDKFAMPALGRKET